MVSDPQRVAANIAKLRELLRDAATKDDEVEPAA
jgi:hypothetical protein